MRRLLPALALLLIASEAHALPRFAARGGTECIQCHVSPTGGGMRNAYGRNVFERTWLPLSGRREGEPWPPELDMPAGPTDAGSEPAPDDADLVGFSGDINEWLAVGSDFRTAYMYTRTDEGATEGADPEVTNSFFVMQAYAYLSAQLHEHVTFLLQLGPYQGFEAWGLFDVFPDADPVEGDWNLMVKVGRFYPSFGLRQPDHDIFSRQWIGLGNADRDTGVELTAYTGPITTNVAVLNGTFGDTTLDVAGSDRSTFEKAVVARVAAHHDLGFLQTRAGLSFYWSENNNQSNPLFSTVLPPAVFDGVTVGVDELRAGAFLTLNVGRLTYLGDLVWVRNDFNEVGLEPVQGYASYQELSFLAIQGLDVLATFEFMDHDLELLETSGRRVGLAIEFFPWPFTEFRIMGRRLWEETMPTGGAWDVAVFTHLFL